MPPPVCQAKRSVGTAVPRRRALSDIGLPRACAGADEAFLLQLARDGHDLLLRLLDLAQPDRAEDLHLLLHQVDGTLRHVREEALADRLARALERQRQHLFVGPVDDFADARFLDVDQILENEHQVPDRRRRVGRERLQALERRAPHAAIEAVEQLGHGAHAAALLAALPAEPAQALLDDARHARDDVGRNLAEIGHAQQYVGPHLLGQLLEQLRSHLRRHVREDQRRRLRMLAEEELRQLRRIGALERRKPGARVKRLNDAIDDAARLIGTERSHEHPARLLDAPERLARGARRLVNLHENLLAELRRYGAERGNLARDRLDLVLAQILEDRGGALLT